MLVIFGRGGRGEVCVFGGGVQCARSSGAVQLFERLAVFEATPEHSHFVLS